MAEASAVLAGGAAFPEQLAGFLLVVHLLQPFLVQLIRFLVGESGGLHAIDVADDFDVNLS